jgi:hypothetical protein
MDKQRRTDVAAERIEDQKLGRYRLIEDVPEHDSFLKPAPSVFSPGYMNAQGA